ncbi:MAG: hypothetical protein JWR80_7966 [Bradyrhizobium sp.]|nr:hypothetical protein [Bradyrhizobium sp.]
MKETLDKGAVEAIDELSRKAAAEVVTITLNTPIPGLPDSVPALLDKVDGKVLSVMDVFERHRTHPLRKTGTAKVTTLESFIELVARHATPESVIFADTDWTKPAMTAVIDYHRQNDIETKQYGAADNGKHRIHYAFPLSVEWHAWTKQDGEKMGQADFAQWIEDHITELAAPDGREAEEFQSQFGFKVAHPNELQQLSRGLQIRVETNIKSSVVLQSGESVITFEESHRDAQGQQLTIPGLFILSIAPFFMGEKCRIPVRLRYRGNSGKPIWSFHIFRPDTYITEQVRTDLETAARDLGLPAFEGTPEMSAT